VLRLACAWEGVLLLSNAEPGERNQGRQLLDAACKADEPFACYFVGLLAYTGAGVRKDERQAAELFRRACDAGEPKACAARAYVLDFGKGVKRDSTAAAKLLERTCGNANEDACDHLGVLNWAGRGVTANPDRARTLFDEACRHGRPRACAHLGAAFAFTDGKQKDGRALLELACSKDDAVGCLGIGAWHRLFGKPADAVQPLTRTCRKDLGIACRLLGVLYANGHGVVQDEATATELAKRACELEDAHGCADWAFELEQHDHVALAVGLLRKACERAPPSGCFELGRLAYWGKGMRKDPSLASRAGERRATPGTSRAAPESRAQGSRALSQHLRAKRRKFVCSAGRAALV
jgi:TPR repeat protein